MKIGTKSLLFGTHNIILHPILVAIAWTKLYGFPKSVKLWLAFIVHDWGYWGKSNLDGNEGIRHPELGANLMHKWFDKGNTTYWYNFTIGHSMNYCKEFDKVVSRLCVADKLAITLYSPTIFVFITQLSGELKEYIGVPAYYEKYNMRVYRKNWFKDRKKYLTYWVAGAKTLY